MFPHKYILPLGIASVLALAIGGALFYKAQMDKVPVSTAVHVHSDLLVYVADERLRLTDEKYQSKLEHILHKDFHFHNGNDDVIHRHAADLTLAEFFSSLGFILTNDCLTTDDDRQFCSGGEDELVLFVDGERREDIVSYVPEEEDRILLYFGNPANQNLPGYESSVSDRACIYSYNCPERGTPPPEECGLTCEL